jgi:hypothetical protein
MRENLRPALIAAIAGASLLGAMAGASAALPATAAKRYFACTGGAGVPCSFSTPSGNVRCRWAPSPNHITCVLAATRLAYQLRPTGRALRVHRSVPLRGQTLPTDQTVVFPDKLSCHDTRTSMTCNQDFGTGAFTLSPAGSHAS